MALTEPNVNIFQPDGTEQLLQQAAIENPVFLSQLFAQRMRRQGAEGRYIDALNNTNTAQGQLDREKMGNEMFTSALGNTKAMTDSFSSTGTSDILNRIAEKAGMSSIIPKNEFMSTRDQQTIDAEAANIDKTKAEAFKARQPDVDKPKIPKVKVLIPGLGEVERDATPDEVARSMKQATPRPTATSAQKTDVLNSDPKAREKRAVADKIKSDTLIRAGGKFVKEDVLDNGDIQITYTDAQGNAGTFIVDDAAADKSYGRQSR